MTGPAFRALLDGLDLTQLQAAEFLRVQPTTVNRWVRGKRKVPGPAIAALEALREQRTLEAKLRAFGAERGAARSVSTTTSGASTNLGAFQVQNTELRKLLTQIHEWVTAYQEMREHQKAKK